MSVFTFAAALTTVNPPGNLLVTLVISKAKLILT